MEETAVARNPFVLESDYLLRREQDKAAAATVRRCPNAPRARPPPPSPPPHPPTPAQLRAANAHKPVWERMDFGSTMARTRKLVSTLEPSFRPADLKRLEAVRKEQSSLAASMSRDRRAERESLIDLVSKKREMLLAQMGLAHTRDEVKRLAGALEARERTLTKAEETLEEDAVNFDVFLQSTETAATAAEKKAEVAMRAKAEKALELKRVRLLISAVAAEKGKLMESLGEYQRYEAFLDAQTPAEWVEAALARQEALRSELRAQALEEASGAWEAQLRAKTAELEAGFARERRAALRMGKAFSAPPAGPLALAALPPKPVLEDIPPPELSEQQLEVPMFFESPHQLKEIFTKLEESNLFLIQQCQDTEQALEELRSQHADSVEAMERQDKALEQAEAVLLAQISLEEAKLGAVARAAAAGVGGGSSGSGGGSDNLLERVQPRVLKRVVQVYERCGFKASASSDVIGMLTGMEAKLERLAARVLVLDPGYVTAKLREKERDRRARVMAARKAKDAALHEVRLAKMLERAQAPRLPRAGKPVMYRSVLPAEVDGAVQQAVEEAAQDEGFFFAL